MVGGYDGFGGEDVVEGFGWEVRMVVVVGEMREGEVMKVGCRIIGKGVGRMVVGEMRVMWENGMVEIVGIMRVLEDV